MNTFRRWVNCNLCLASFPPDGGFARRGHGRGASVSYELANESKINVNEQRLKDNDEAWPWNTSHGGRRKVEEDRQNSVETISIILSKLLVKKLFVEYFVSVLCPRPHIITRCLFFFRKCII